MIDEQPGARVRLVEVPQSEAEPDGAVTSKQVAEVTLPRAALDELWTPEYLERLARTYWRFLTRLFLGLLRVVYLPDARLIVFLTRPFVLLRFHAPEYEVESDKGTVTWRIAKGLLVAPNGRGKGFLRLTVSRKEERGDEAIVEVSSEVANFYPIIQGWGRFARFGRHLYRVTQLKLHVIVTNSFLRSLARLDLPRSRVRALEQPPG